MTDKPATPTQPCDVTVTVSGDRGSGKSYLIAVLAQALRGAGHTAITQDHIPSALKAITDLSKPYNVTFREQEQDKVDEAVSVLHDAADEITSLRAANAALTAKSDRLSATLNEFRQTNIRIAKDNDSLREQIEILKDFTGNGLPQAEVERLITAAMTHVRDATIIEQSRNELQRRAEDLKSESSKLRHEAEARNREARAMLEHALTGKRPQSSAQTHIERRVAARVLSASERLAIANGADPDVIGAGAAGRIVAESLDEHAHAIAEEMAEVASEGAAEATLASAIESALLNRG